ncbi:MAG: polysaccharide deacetylase family protein [Candidatus Woesebacteria bacterium]|nr:MAG: polysaccharide deacetylase family protein [Candidatus Woesebacteria bacterium]
MYVERGSPYDNRTVEGTNPSEKVIFHGSRDKKQIAITFDAEMTDGMKADLVSGKVAASYDKRIVDILNQTKTKATFFLTGLWIELYPDVTSDLSKNPLFEIGSHSYTDSSYYGFCFGLKQLPNTVKVEDIGATEKLIREHAHIDNRLFRFPGGCYTPDDVKLVNEANDTVVHWDVSGNDGFNTNNQQIVNNVLSNTQNGSIIILHLNGAPNAPKTAEALPELISNLKKRGYEFVKVSELLGLTPAPKVSQ